VYCATTATSVTTRRLDFDDPVARVSTYIWNQEIHCAILWDGVVQAKEHQPIVLTESLMSIKPEREFTEPRARWYPDSPFS
jgi:hypothetical protein